MEKENDLTHKILIKLNENDKMIAKKLKEMGMNLTQLFRIMIREKYEKMMNEK